MNRTEGAAPKIQTADDLLAYLAAPQFVERYRQLANKLATAPRLTEGEKADALGLPWWGYAAIQSLALAMQNPGTEVRIYDEDDRPCRAIKIDAPVTN